jgi:Uma2 family endonuclease
MNVVLPLLMDKSAFLAWAREREGRYELVGGRVVVMAGASRHHAIIVGNLYSITRAQIDSTRWTVLADFGLDGGPETLRYPDIMIDEVNAANAYAAAAPVLVAEVLSPSTPEIDLGDKTSEYLALPSLRTYLVLAQSEPKVWIWRRQDDRFPSSPRIITGLDKVIRIAELNLALPLGAIYAGVL